MKSQLYASAFTLENTTFKRATGNSKLEFWHSLDHIAQAEVSQFLIIDGASQSIDSLDLSFFGRAIKRKKRSLQPIAFFLTTGQGFSCLPQAPASRIPPLLKTFWTTVTNCSVQRFFTAKIFCMLIWTSDLSMAWLNWHCRLEFVLNHWINRRMSSLFPRLQKITYPHRMTEHKILKYNFEILIICKFLRFLFQICRGRYFQQYQSSIQ